MCCSSSRRQSERGLDGSAGNQKRASRLSPPAYSPGIKALARERHAEQRLGLVPRADQLQAARQTGRCRGRTESRWRDAR